MTINLNYFEQLKDSSDHLQRVKVPEVISQKIAERLNKISKRSNLEAIKKIKYIEKFNENNFISSKHLVRVKLSGWQFEIKKVQERENSYEEEILIIINKVGSSNSKHYKSDHRNGNNSIKYSKSRSIRV